MDGERVIVPARAMNPTNNSTNDFDPDETIPTIVAFQNAWSDCLECAGEPPTLVEPKQHLLQHVCRSGILFR